MKRQIKYFALIAAASALLSACDSTSTGVDFSRQANVATSNGSNPFMLPKTGPNRDDVAMQYITQEGGTVAVGGHRMVVPPGAVAQPTWFRMRVVGSDRIHVKLKAWRANDWTPVSQFPNSAPIELKLDVSKVTGIDLSKLLVVYLAEESYDGLKEPVRSSLSAETNVLTGYLTHFSSYAAASREYSIGMD